MTTLELSPPGKSSKGFAANDRKTHLYRRSNRQIVTGLVVNQRTNTPRELRRTVRAILHNAARTGLQAQNRHGYPNFRAYLQGLIGYITEANAKQGQELLEALRAVKD
jgi:RNA-directed DNA polymerase